MLWDEEKVRILFAKNDGFIPKAMALSLYTMDLCTKNDEICAKFGLEYDLDLFNIVAVSHFGGAMENKSLNIFSTGAFYTVFILFCAVLYCFYTVFILVCAVFVW